MAAFRPPLGQPFWKPSVDIPVEPPTGWHNEAEQPSKTPRPIAAAMRTAAVAAAAAFGTGPWAPPPIPPQIQSSITGAAQPTVLFSQVIVDPTTGPVAPPAPPVVVFTPGDLSDQHDDRPVRARQRRLENEPLISASAPAIWSDQHETPPLKVRQRQAQIEPVVAPPAAPVTLTPSFWVDYSDLGRKRAPAKQPLEIVWPAQIPTAAPAAITCTITGAAQPIALVSRLVYDARTGPVFPPPAATATPAALAGAEPQLVKTPRKYLAKEDFSGPPLFYTVTPTFYPDYQEQRVRARTKAVPWQDVPGVGLFYTVTPDVLPEFVDQRPQHPRKKLRLEQTFFVEPAAVTPSILGWFDTSARQSAPAKRLTEPFAFGAPVVVAVTLTPSDFPDYQEQRTRARAKRQPDDGSAFVRLVDIAATPAFFADYQEQRVRARAKTVRESDLGPSPVVQVTFTPSDLFAYEEQRVRAPAKRRPLEEASGVTFVPVTYADTFTSTWRTKGKVWRLEDAFVRLIEVTLTPSFFADDQQQPVKAPPKRLPKEEASGVTFVPVTYADTFTSVWTGKKKQLRLEQTFFVEPLAVTPAALEWFDTSSRIRTPPTKQPDPFSFIFPSFVAPPTTTPSDLADVAYLNSVLKPNKVAIFLALDGLAWAPQERPIGVVEQPPGGIGKPPVGRYALYIEWCPRDRFWRCIKPQDWVAEDTLGIDVQVTAPQEIIDRTRIKGLPKVARRALGDLAPKPIRVTYVLQPPPPDDDDDEEELMINLLLNS